MASSPHLLLSFLGQDIFNLYSLFHLLSSPLFSPVFISLREEEKSKALEIVPSLKRLWRVEKSTKRELCSLRISFVPLLCRLTLGAGLHPVIVSV
jgi:hypothetical protein